MQKLYYQLKQANDENEKKNNIEKLSHEHRNENPIKALIGVEKNCTVELTIFSHFTSIYNLHSLHVHFKIQPIVNPFFFSIQQIDDSISCAI